jgi:hypothetical protein
MDFCEKMNFFKTSKNSYTWPFHITDLEYGGHGHEIRNFGQFLLQTEDIR